MHIPVQVNGKLMKVNSSQISRKSFHTKSTKVALTDSEKFDINPEGEANNKESSQVPLNDIKSM